MGLIKPSDPFPRRGDFADLKEREKIDDGISSRKPIYFMPVSLNESPFGDYKIYLHGCLLSGDKATVIINKTPIFFDIRIPEGVSSSKFKNDVIKVHMDHNIKIGRMDVFNALAFKGYGRRGNYMRIYNDTIKERKTLIQFFDSNKYILQRDGKKEQIAYETAYDDLSCYYRKATRENNFSISDWCLIKQYTITKNSTISKADYTINCNYKDIEAQRIDKTKDENMIYANDKTMVMSWDIETHSYAEDGGVPLPERDTDEMFMCGITFNWRYTKKPFLRVGIVTRDCDFDPETMDILIRAADEREMLMCFAKLIQSMLPDFVTEFNGGQYDWPWFLDRAARYNVLLPMLRQMSIMKTDQSLTAESAKWFIKTNEIKIEAEKKHKVQYVRAPGFEAMDVCPQMRRLYKTSEQYSLKFFLDQCKLSSKLDMPYTRLQEIFRQSDNLDDVMVNKWIKKQSLDISIEQFRKRASKNMAEAMNYCLIDAQRCQDLLLFKNIICDIREVASQSYTSIYDGIYLADGMKVKNMLLYWAMKRGLEPSTIAHPTTTAKFPGAYVVPPEIGLENKRPVTGLDFASLYPSLIMTYNISAEYIVFTKEEKEQREKEGHTMHHIEFEYNGSMLEAWTVRHDNKEEKMGIYPYILQNLFAQRKSLKNVELVPLNHKLEELDKERAVLTEALKDSSKDTLKEGDKENKINSSTKSEKLDKINEEYSNTKVKYEYVNSKQKALKVFMNTFYGLLGDPTNSLYIVELAGAVTSAGIASLKKVHKFVTKNGYKVKYGDTDSLYIIPPDSVFTEVDELYKKKKITKMEYWTKMVELTMKDLATFKDKVNNMLFEDNGTKFLNMAYEEVLFPVAFLAKKMYFGIPHENIVNFKPKKLFMRGVAVVKRGVPDYIKILDHEIMWEAMSVDNVLSMHDIVVTKLHGVTKRNWTLDDFAETADYRPAKDQKSLKMFVNSLPKKLQPKPGVRFSYIVAEKYPFKYTMEGKREKLKKGDKMMYLDEAKKTGAKPDMEHYLLGRVVGQFSQFIAGEEQFAAKDIKSSKKKAEKYIKQLCLPYLTKFANKSSLYKDVYKYTRSFIDEQYDNMYRESSSILKMFKDNPKQDILKNSNTQVAGQSRRKDYKENICHVVKSLAKERDVLELWGIYYSSHNSIYRRRKRYISIENKKLDRQLDDLLPKISTLLDESNNLTNNIITKIHADLKLDEIGKTSNKIPKLGDLMDVDDIRKKIEKKISTVQRDSANNELLTELNDMIDKIYEVKMFDRYTEDLIKGLSNAKSVKLGNLDIGTENVNQKEDIFKLGKDLDLGIPF